MYVRPEMARPTDYRTHNNSLTTPLRAFNKPGRLKSQSPARLAPQDTAAHCCPAATGTAPTPQAVVGPGSTNPMPMARKALDIGCRREA